MGRQDEKDTELRGRVERSEKRSLVLRELMESWKKKELAAEVMEHRDRQVLADAIDELCQEFKSDHDGIHDSDVHAALARVKWNWMLRYFEGLLEPEDEKGEEAGEP